MYSNEDDQPYNPFSFFKQKAPEVDESQLLIDDKDIICLHNWALTNKKFKEFLHEQMLKDYIQVTHSSSLPMCCI